MEIFLTILYWMMWVYLGGAVVTGLLLLFKDGVSTSERLRTIFLWPLYAVFLVLLVGFWKGN